MTSRQTFLYLSREDVAGIAIDLSVARRAVIDSFRAIAKGQSHSLPKSTLAVAPGHGFQAMLAAAPADDIVGLKWLGFTAQDNGPGVPNIQAVICLNDYRSGSLLVMMDGDLVTLLRTAAMSAAASSFLAEDAPRSLGLIGCGAQAYAHLDAFRALYPTLATIHAYSRNVASAERLVARAAELGLDGAATPSAETVVRQSDIVITMVPASEGLVAFLDPCWLKPTVFVSAVDFGRSWMDAGIDMFDVLATDALTQTDTYPGRCNQRFHVDLVGLAGAVDRRQGGRAMFCFKGFAIADLAVAALVYQAARRQGIGTVLPR